MLQLQIELLLELATAEEAIGEAKIRLTTPKQPRN
jgi:hypothetical protein